MKLKPQSTRIAYGEALVALAEKYPYIVMDADLSKATQTCHFAASYPERFFNMGIGEGNMYAAAAGFASCGIPVVASTFAIFAAGRAYEPIRQMVAHTHLNVKIGATHAGVMIGQDGGSHQAIEDLALMRVLPGMTVLSPGDASSTPRLLELALKHDGPVYLRLDRFPTRPVYDVEDDGFRIGGSRMLRTGSDAALIATGSMVPTALEAAELLAGQGIHAAVVDMYSVKPMDTDMVLRCAQGTRRLFTLEDHSIIGGLGSAVSEFLMENHPVPVSRIGIPDVFGRSGSPDELAAYFGLTPDAVAKTVIRRCA